jgi:hypothetical protein
MVLQQNLFKKLAINIVCVSRSIRGMLKEAHFLGVIYCTQRLLNLILPVKYNFKE